MIDLAPQNGFEAVVASDLKEVQIVLAELIELLKSHAYSDHDVFCIRLAVEEALANAVIHGNQENTSKSIRFSCCVDSSCAHIEVEDEGCGFSLDEVPDPTEDENLDRPSGRGLLLMRSMMTSIEFNERGNQVVLEKVRQPSPAGIC